MATKKTKAVSSSKAVNQVTAGVSPKPIGPVVPIQTTTGVTVAAPISIGSLGIATAVPPVTSARIPSGLQEELQELLQGIQTILPAGSSLQAVNGSYTQAAMIAQLQGYLNLYSNVATLVTSLQTARLGLKAQVPSARQYYTELKEVLTAFFHAGNPALTSFGFKPKKAPATKSVETKAAAVQRGAQTRLMRGTMGKRAKQKVKYTGPLPAPSAPAGTTEAAAGQPAATPASAAGAVNAAPVKPSGQ